jgi:uncharacterized membrane protein YkvI
MKTPIDPRQTTLPTAILIVSLTMLLSFLATAALYSVEIITSRTTAVMPVIVLFPVLSLLSLIFEIRHRRYNAWLTQEWEILKKEWEASIFENQSRKR